MTKPIALPVNTPVEHARRKHGNHLIRKVVYIYHHTDKLTSSQESERASERERDREEREGETEVEREGEGRDWGKGGSMLQPQTDRQRAIQRESFKTVTGTSKMPGGGGGGEGNDEAHCTSCEYASRTRP